MLQGIDDLQVGLVPRLVELMTTGTYERVGGKERVAADVRWVLSGRGPEEFKAARALPGLRRISVPALRSRPEDIPILVDRMIERYGDGSVREIAADAMALLRRHPFPGNVRELEGLIERACLLADRKILLPEHFPDLSRQVH